MLARSKLFSYPHDYPRNVPLNMKHKIIVLKSDSKSEARNIKKSRNDCNNINSRNTEQSGDGCNIIGTDLQVQIYNKLARTAWIMKKAVVIAL